MYRYLAAAAVGVAAYASGVGTPDDTSVVMAQNRVAQADTYWNRGINLIGLGDSVTSARGYYEAVQRDYETSKMIHAISIPAISASAAFLAVLAAERIMRKKRRVRFEEELPKDKPEKDEYDVLRVVEKAIDDKNYRLPARKERGADGKKHRPPKKSRDWDTIMRSMRTMYDRITSELDPNVRELRQIIAIDMLCLVKVAISECGVPLSQHAEEARKVASILTTVCDYDEAEFQLQLAILQSANDRSRIRGLLADAIRWVLTHPTYRGKVLGRRALMLAENLIDDLEEHRGVDIDEERIPFVHYHNMDPYVQSMVKELELLCRE